MARLQSEFCTKDFFRATNFLTKNAPKFSPRFLSLCSVGVRKNPRPNFPAKNQKKFTDKLLQEHRENKKKNDSARASEELQRGWRKVAQPEATRTTSGSTQDRSLWTYAT